MKTKIIFKKAKTLLTLDLNWAIPFARKRLSHLLDFWFSKLTGRKFYDVNVSGVKLKLGFFTPYHQRIAKFISQGKHEGKVLDIWASLCKSKKIIYDVGGFNGVYGLVAAKINPDSNVIIFDPDPIHAEHCRLNVKLNNLTNVVIEEAAISSFNGNVKFRADGTTGGAVSDSGSIVGCKTIDSYEVPDLIKIDIEGYELELFKGAKKLLNSNSTILLEIHHWLKEKDELWRLLKDFKSEVINEETKSKHYLFKK